jgi:hypothetical protein
MANPDQKTILIDNAYEEIKNICINLQKDSYASNLEVKSLLKLIMKQWEEKKRTKNWFWIQVKLAISRSTFGMKLFQY